MKPKAWPISLGKSIDQRNGRMIGFGNGWGLHALRVETALRAVCSPSWNLIGVRLSTGGIRVRR
jgi:hypothetical protein